MASKAIVQAVAVTAEIMGTVMSPAAAALFCEDMEGYPESAVLRALARCRREVRGRLTQAEVISRIDDGRPGVEEAWAQLPKDELTTVVWCDEAAEAYGIALPLIQDGDMVAARMAFKEAYQNRVAQSRDEKRPAIWRVSLGRDIEGRRVAIEKAAEQGKLSAPYAAALLPPPEMVRGGGDALTGAVKLIFHEAKKTSGADLKGRLSALKQVLKGER